MSVKKIEAKNSISSEVANKNYQHIQELNSAYLKKQLIVFYGAGLSIPLGLPGWKQLIDYVIDKVIENSQERKKCREKISNGSFWESMEYIKDIAKVDEDKIKSLIAECIKSSQDNNEDDMSAIDNNYKDLSNSEINFFITTNYDTFLEKVDNRCESYDIDGLKDKALAELFSPKEKKKKILYLHGHVNKESSIIITKEAVENIYQNKKWISVFQGLLNHYHILFIGVSFKDEYLKKFLSQSAENNNNSYFVITDSDVDIECKKIIIPQNDDQRVYQIRKILDQIKEQPEETIWIRISVENANLEKVKNNIKKELDKNGIVKYELIEQTNYLILAVIHMIKSATIQDAFAPYKRILDSRNIRRYINHNNKVCFYSSNKDNFSEIDYKKIFKNQILNLFQKQLYDESNGYIIDRIGLEANDDSADIFQKFRMVRCNLSSDKVGNGHRQQKDYSFYVDESISLKDASEYGVEVHVSGFCFFNDKLLMENRSQKTAIAAGMIAPIGGRMRAEEGFKQALARHFRDDCNLLIDNIEVCDVFTTFNANVPGVAFICNSKGIHKRNAKLSAKYDLYTKEQLLDLYDSGKLACEKELLLKAFEQKQIIRKKTIKLRIVMWSNCCYKCKGCHHENLNNTSMIYNSKAVLQNLIKLGELFDVRQITVTGGEPLHDISQLEVLIKEIANNFPMTDIAVITNGEKLESKIIQKLSKYNIRYKMSLYGFDNDSFKRYTGFGGYKREDYITKFQSKLQLLNDKNIRYTVNIPVQKFILCGLRQLFDNNKMQELLLKQNIKIKLIDMVKPRSDDNDLFDDLYVPVEEAKQSLLDNTAISNSDHFDKLIKNFEFFEYPCKSCIGYKEDCFENFALTIEPDGRLLVCRNAVQQLYIGGQSFMDFMHNKGIEIEIAEYNKDYGGF